MSTENNVVKINPLKMVELPDTIKVVITSKAYAQISFLIQKIHSVEWSALLLYKANGHITDPSKMECIVDSVYLMDKGSKATTSHEYDSDSIVNMFNDFPEYMDMKIGHIHSHNTMDSFFSSVDVNELKDNVVNHVYYLSLIVNNKGDFKAKLCYIGKQQSKIGILNKKGIWTWSKKASVIEEEVMFVHNCKITLEMKDADKFNKRFKEVSEKSLKIPEVSKVITDTGKSSFYDKNLFPPSYKSWDFCYTEYPKEQEPPKRTALAKALLTCSVIPDSRPLYTIVKESEKTFNTDDDDAITMSFLSFFVEISPEFPEIAFKTIYDMKDIDFNSHWGWNWFIKEIEAAANLIPERVGDCIREALDDYLMEKELIRQDDESSSTDRFNTFGHFNI